MSPARQHTAQVLRDARDELHDELVAQCERLLDHDARVKAAVKELQRVTDLRDDAKLRLEAMRLKGEDIEAAYLQLTGFNMPGYSPLK